MGPIGAPKFAIKGLYTRKFDHCGRNTGGFDPKFRSLHPWGCSNGTQGVLPPSYDPYRSIFDLKWSERTKFEGFWVFFTPKIDLTVVILVLFGRELKRWLGTNQCSIDPRGLRNWLAHWATPLAFRIVFSHDS